MPIIHEDWTHSLRDLMRIAGSDDDGESDNIASFIGIIVAISGNVLISLALNCQKLAHKRLERERRSGHTLEDNRRVQGQGQSHRFTGRNNGFENDNVTEPTYTSSRRIVEMHDADADDEDDDERTRVGESSQHQSPNSDAESDYEGAIPFPSSSSGRESPSPAPRGPSFRDTAHTLLVETQPLLVVSDRAVVVPKGSMRGGYGTAIEIGNRSRESSSEADRGSWRERNARTRSAPHLLTHLFSPRAKKVNDMDIEATAIPVDIRVNGEDSGYSTPARQQRVKFAEPKVHEENEADYLKSKLWWLGLILMAIGEMGNFISYGFAPASVVAPLGTFALIANCFFAPLMLKERFRKRDLLGILLAILGAITVVLSASSSDRRLDPDALIHAITQKPFIVLAAIYAGGAAFLVSLSSQRLGQEHVWVDVGACALFGGFTVLSTKAFSSLLAREWVALFKEWITYPVLAVLIGTGIGQIRYLNRALMKFDSKVVIPAQFVLFNISAIVGSAVLYGDFRSATLHQMVTFLYGCGATFAGVFMLTWSSNDAERGKGNARVEVSDQAERRRRAQLVVPETLSPPRPAPLLRAKTSSITLSPAQQALLIRTLSESEEMDESSASR
ncbi:hypothetical protein ACEPAG_6413 [Sanghuangporus baumii]